MKRIEQSAYRWKKTYEKNGLIGLTDSCRTQSGRPLKRKLTPFEVIKRQEGKNQVTWRAGGTIKKLEETEKRLLNASENLKPNKVYQLIYMTIEHNQFK